MCENADPRQLPPRCRFNPPTPRTLGAMAVAGVVLLGAGGCSSSASAGRQAASGSMPASSTGVAGNDGVQVPPEIKSAGKLVFCTDISYPPQEFFKSGTTTPQGSDIDVSKAIGSLWNVSTTNVNTSFDGIIPALESNKCDAIISGMTATADRAKQVTFILYTQSTSSVMALKSNSSASVTGLSSLSGKRVGVQIATTQDDALKAENKTLAAAHKPPIQITLYPTTTAVAAALVTKRVDYYFGGTNSVVELMKQKPGVFEQVGPTLLPNYEGIAVRKNDTALRDGFVAAVKTLYANGTIQRIMKHWSQPAGALPASKAGAVVQ